MGLSRDDAGRFLPDYVDEKKAGIFHDDPFQTLDQAGVGMLMKWAIERGRATRPKLHIGICGEHGGDAESVKFCHRLKMDYVSASPFRVPIARLAAAQAVLESKASHKKSARPRKPRVKSQRPPEPLEAKQRVPHAPVSRVGLLIEALPMPFVVAVAFRCRRCLSLSS